MKEISTYSRHYIRSTSANKLKSGFILQNISFCGVSLLQNIIDGLVYKKMSPHPASKIRVIFVPGDLHYAENEELRTINLKIYFKS